MNTYLKNPDTVKKAILAKYGSVYSFAKYLGINPSNVYKLLVKDVPLSGHFVSYLSFALGCAVKASKRRGTEDIQIEVLQE